MSVLEDFVRRVNKDSTVDLICTRCFRTVIHAMDDSGFEDAERKHRCDPNDVSPDRFAQPRVIEDH